MNQPYLLNHRRSLVMKASRRPYLSFAFRNARASSSHDTTAGQRSSTFCVSAGARISSKTISSRRAASAGSLSASRLLFCLVFTLANSVRLPAASVRCEKRRRRQTFDDGGAGSFAPVTPTEDYARAPTTYG